MIECNFFCGKVNFLVGFEECKLLNVFLNMYYRETLRRSTISDNKPISLSQSKWVKKNTLIHLGYLIVFEK